MRWSDAVGAVCNILVAVAAVAALLYAHLQISEGRFADRQAEANELWRETVRLGFENPKLSNPSLKLADFDYLNLTVDGSRETFEKYELFVDTILNASESIMEVLPNKQWEATVASELNQHRDFLLSEHFRDSGYQKQYTPKFLAFLRKALDQPAAGAEVSQ